MATFAEIYDRAISGTSDERKYLCSLSSKLFMVVYFPQYFTHKIPGFHTEFYTDIDDLLYGRIDEAVWVAFRDSGKTSVARKAGAIMAIVYNKAHYIPYISKDKGNSEQALFDIISELQTNKLLVSDFGNLYNESRTSDDVKMKRVSSFITTNKKKMEAFSTQESMRGRLYNNKRPDFCILDDIENDKSILSVPETQKVINFVQEMKAGLPADARVLYLCNYISETGSIAFIMNMVGKNPRGRVRNIPVENNGAIAWPDKFVATDKERDELNALIVNPSKRKKSLESIKRDLGPRYATEMLNDPSSSGSTFFDRLIIDRLLKLARKPVQEIAGLRIYWKYNPSHRYAVSGDTAGGTGLDSNASAIIDFSAIPARLAACYDNNEITPDIFAHELKRQGLIYGECILAPEINAQSGGTCLNELKKIYPIDKIYRRSMKDRMTNKLTEKIGWETTSSTKPEILFQLKSAVENGTLEIADERILRELRSYSQGDLIHTADINTTRHYDLLMAVAICWAMRDYAKLMTPTQTSSYKQPEYESPSITSHSSFNDDENNTPYPLRGM